MDAAKPNHIEVIVVTTSGTFPTTGVDEIPVHQLVSMELAKATKALEITDTTGWVARVNGTEIDVNKSYTDNHLSGSITIDFGKREGGGGCTS
jgi:hypothetical protein